VSRLLKRLRTHGLVKKVGHTYKYYVTAFGKVVVATALKLRELVIIPELALGLAQQPHFPAGKRQNLDGERQNRSRLVKSMIGRLHLPLGRRKPVAENRLFLVVVAI
jgi:hypothetical protein